MKTHLLILAMTGAAVLMTGCVNPNGTPNHTGSGALMGGAGDGGLTSLDQEQQARLRQEAPVTYTKVDQGQPLSIADVKALAKAGLSEDVIINQIKNSYTVYHLMAADIIDLEDAGVPDKVVNYMIHTPDNVANRPYFPPTVVQPPPVPPQPVIASPGPGYVWIGGEWAWNGANWFWIAGRWGYPPYPNAYWIPGQRWHDAYGWHYYRGRWH